MATIRVYYKRFSDINYNDYNLFYFAGNGVYGDDAKLFPDIDLDIQNPYGPRSKEDFTVDSGLGYVDIEMNTSKKVAFYIRRKDFRFDYNGEYDEGLNLEDDSLNEYKYEVGYVWEIDLNIAPCNSSGLIISRPISSLSVALKVIIGLSNNSNVGVLLFDISTMIWST